MKINPRVTKKLRALAGRRIVFEGFGPRAPSYLAIGNGDHVEPAWISRGELRRLVAAARKVLR